MCCASEAPGEELLDFDLHGHVRRQLVLAPGNAMLEFSSDLRGNLVMCLEAKNLEESILLLRRKIGFVPAKRRGGKQVRQMPLRLILFERILAVPLCEYEESLMPEDGHLTLVPLESEEVEDEGVDNLVREGVLLVEKDADEETVGTCSCRRSWSILWAHGGLWKGALDGPVYSISASLRRAAPECSTGTDTFVNTEPRMAASRKVHVPLCTSKVSGRARCGKNGKDLPRKAETGGP